MIHRDSRDFFEQDITGQNGFKDVPITLLTSGELGNYYINTEVVARDGGLFKIFEDDPLGMYKYTLGLMEKHPNYCKGIELIAAKVRQLLPQDRAAISGGQTRDWLFSMPVARLLGVPHLAIFKPEKGGHITGQINGGRALELRASDEYHAVQVSDLLTKGSSFYEVVHGKPQGWIESLKNGKVTMKDAVVVVSRMQGGEKNLEDHGVTPHTFLDIDEEFLRKHSKNVEGAVAFHKDTLGESKKYFAQHGVRQFGRYFNPSAGKLDRAAGFLELYSPHLEETGQMKQLEDAVIEHFHLSPAALARGETRYSSGHTLYDKWHAAVAQKNSVLCVGLDPQEHWQAVDNTLPEGKDKLEWCVEIIEKVAPYAAAIKPNFKFVRNFSRKERQMLTDLIRSHGMVSIDDEKPSDIGNSNDSSLYNTDIERYDCSTYTPFAGNTQEAAKQAHNRGLGIIGMCIMSNADYKDEKCKWAPVDNPDDYRLQDVEFIRGRAHVPQYVKLAHTASVHGWDGIVIGAPSPTNHITAEEIATIRHYAHGGKILALVPGIGKQGGEEDLVLQTFSDNAILNVGSAIIYSKDPAAEARAYRDRFNALRNT